MGTLCQAIDVGTIDYADARILQSALAAELAAGIRSDCILLLQHPHTYTLGSSANYEDLIYTDDQLIHYDIVVCETDRGGGITYHGPGQLIGYPILDLGSVNVDDSHTFPSDYISYIRKLEVMLINVLGYFGIKSTQVPGLTGVWVESGASSTGQLTPCKANDLPRKIGSIGIRVDKNGISQHGFAINIDIQEPYFKGIVPCGLEGYGTISMSEVLSDVPTIQDVQSIVIREFGRMFDKEMVSSDRLLVDSCVYRN
ncbi:MAG: lipoate-protein ligase B [Anaerolineaceae bacterium]|nr:lipoate-protein ligase B [Anaerolineaceae bacterium]|tara:strand:+ start:87 stop:854 length:768 start_codon:yes stop_codon:yes gene_type:complete